MSRVGKIPIEIPSGVEVKLNGNTLSVKGPKGELEETYDSRINIAVEKENITVTRSSDAKELRALHGLTRALIANMIIGVSEGYEKVLQLIGIGFSSQLKGKNIIFSLGFSHQILFEAPDGIEFEIQKPEQQEKAQFRAIQSRIFIRGISKQLVGQVTANIRALKPPEPYKGKGIRLQGEYVRKKAGKQVATTVA